VIYSGFINGLAATFRLSQMLRTSGCSSPSSSAPRKLSTPYYLSAVCSTGCSRSFFFGRSGIISFRHSTPAGSCAALRFCSVLLSSSSISFWRVFIVPRVVGSTAWQVRYCKGSPSARIDEYRRLPAAERQAVREAILRDPGESSE
jgi:hypothetical protein